MKYFLSIVWSIFFNLFYYTTISAQVGIGTNTPDPSAIMDLQSTNKGFLLPRMNTLQQKNIDEPSIGLMIFNIDSNDIYFFNGTIWLAVRDILDTVQTWKCGDSLIDQRDGQIYGSVKIGTQCWMKENLNIGSRINGNQEQTNNGILEKYCYNDLESNCDVYGGLYQWNEMMQYTTMSGALGICPSGWHIPTIDEWTILNDYLGGEDLAGGKMKSTGTIDEGTGLWYPVNRGATNESGFTARPGGYHDSNDGAFVYLGYYWCCWSSLQFDETHSWSLFLGNDYGDLFFWDYSEKQLGFAVRCLLD